MSMLSKLASFSSLVQSSLMVVSIRKNIQWSWSRESRALCQKSWSCVFSKIQHVRSTNKRRQQSRLSNSLPLSAILPLVWHDWLIIFRLPIFLKSLKRLVHVLYEQPLNWIMRNNRYMTFKVYQSKNNAFYTTRECSLQYQIAFAAIIIMSTVVHNSNNIVSIFWHSCVFLEWQRLFWNILSFLIYFPTAANLTL
jgi:hypothetical protein